MEIISDETLKSYFLGTLTVEESERLEEKCAADAELTEQAQIVESELADDYLRENLSADERRLFEENYLTTEARREKLRQAVDLWKVANETQNSVETVAPTFWQTIFANYRALTLGGLASAIIFGAFGLFWLNSAKIPELAKQENTSEMPELELQNQLDKALKNFNAANQNIGIGVKYADDNINSFNQNSQKPAVNTAPKPSATPEIKPTPKPAEPHTMTLAAFVLSPGTLRSEGEQFIKIAPKTDKINLRLSLPKDAVKYQTYRAVLKTADGETVFTSPNLKSFDLSMPAEKLKNQTYIVFLEGRNAQNPAESIAEYTFRVQR